MEKPVLVTGGAGYIGSHTCMLLKQQGFQPIVFDNLNTGHNYAVQWGPLIEGDLQDKQLLSSVFETYHPLAVIHFAADALVEESIINPAKYYMNNIAGTLVLLQVMKAKKVPYLIFSSSCAIYGIPRKIPITEDHAQIPITPYGRSKLMIEQILKDFDRAYGMKFIALRYFNAAGADIESRIGEDHKNETHLLPLILQCALNPKKSLKVFGSDYDTKDGSAVRDYIHVIDLANAHILALHYLLTNKTSDTINLGTARGYSVFEMIHMAEKICHRTIPYQITKRREGDPPILIADKQKAQNLLSWRSCFSSAETIIKTAWMWHQKQHASLP